VPAATGGQNPAAANVRHPGRLERGSKKPIRRAGVNRRRQADRVGLGKAGEVGDAAYENAGTNPNQAEASGTKRI